MTRELSHQEKTQLVLDALEKDPNKKRGYRTTQATIAGGITFLKAEGTRTFTGLSGK
jgi:hypothetical protein